MLGSFKLRKFRFGLIETFLIFITLLFGINLLFDYFTAISAGKKLGRHILDKSEQIVVSELSDIIRSSEFLLGRTKINYSDNMLDFNDLRATNNFFMSYMKRYPFITSINYGNYLGDGYLILGIAGEWKNRIKDAREKDEVLWTALSADGKILSRETSMDDYDPRKRPWYLNAVSKEGIQWSSPYIFRTTKDMGLTASMRIDEGAADKFAVVGIDIMLKDFSHFLSGINTDWKETVINVISDDGTIVASSDVERFEKQLKSGTSVLPNIAQKEFDIYRKAFLEMSIGGKDFIAFKSAGEVLYAKLEKINFGSSSFYVFMTIPEKIFLQDFKNESRIKLAMFFIFLIGASAYFIYYYLLPFRRLTDVVKSLKEGKVYVPLKTKGASDIASLTDEFNTMVTELDKQNERLIKSEKHYRLLFEDNPNPMWVHDSMTLNFIAINNAALLQYGYDREEFLLLKISDLLPEDIADKKEVLFEGVGQGAKISRHKKKNSDIIDVEIVSDKIKWDGHEAVVVLASDISERKKLEARVLQAEKLNAIGQLAGGVAHDFNNILTAIVGYAGLLELKMDKNDPNITNVEHILSSAERATKLTRSLLAFSRKEVLNPKLVGLNEIMRRMEELLYRLIGEDIELCTRFSEKELLVMVDVSQIEQVIMNLVTNARDAMPEGGVLTLSTEESVIDKYFVYEHSYGKPGKYAVISVADTGTGMSEEIKKRIFDPFLTTKEIGKGTGLGLSIVYGIVKQHNGYINVYSEPDKGSVFKIYLPIADRDFSISEPEPHARQGIIGGSERILVAEDDKDTREITVAVLKEFGYSVTEAFDGEDAVKKFNEHKGEFSLVILDVVMPKKNGREAYEEMKQVTPDVNALFISGYTADIIQKKGILDKDFQFLSKPVSPRELIIKVREIIDQSS